MNIVNFKKAIYDWIRVVVLSLTDPAGGAGVTVFWDSPKAPRALDPSVRLNLISGPTKLGPDEMTPDGDSGEFIISGPRNFTMSVSAYGEFALQFVSDLQTSISDPVRIAALTAQNITVLYTDPPRDLTEQKETGYEKRHQMDVYLMTVERSRTEPGTIETVEISSEIGDNSDSIVVDNGG